MLGSSFLPALRDLGWVEGKNLVLEWRYTEEQEDRRRAIVDEFIQLKVDVIVVPSTPEMIVTKRATKTIPVVMVLVGDPVGTGLIESLARPGGNITGTSLMQTDTAPSASSFSKSSCRGPAVWLCCGIRATPGPPANGR